MADRVGADVANSYDEFSVFAYSLREATGSHLMKLLLPLTISFSTLSIQGCGPSVGARVEHGNDGYDMVFATCGGSRPFQKYSIYVRKGSGLICQLEAEYRPGDADDYQEYAQHQLLERWPYGAAPQGYNIVKGGVWSDETSEIVCPDLEPGQEYSIVVIYAGQRGAEGRFKIAQDGSVDMLSRGCD